MTPEKEYNLAGEVIREHLNGRGWAQRDLARILGKTTASVNEVIQGKRGITAETAALLGAAFGNGAAFWLSLDAKGKAVSDNDATKRVRSRVRLYGIAPVREMERRGWIKPGSDAESLQNELCRFFATNNLDEDPTIMGATRRSLTSGKGEFTAAQRAWCFRARQLGAALKVSRFKPNKFAELRTKLRELAAYPSEAQHVADLLGRYGIRFVVIEPLPGTRIDGVALWSASDNPVIGVSLRLNRIDSFWFTLMHELSHIVHQDAISLDVDLTGESRFPSQVKDPIEQRADAEAASFLISPNELDSFIRRVGPLYSKKSIIGFAHRIRIHPGIIVGQLQHVGEIGWNANREMLVKVRDFVADSSLTDGWGHAINPDIL